MTAMEISAWTTFATVVLAGLGRILSKLKDIHIAVNGRLDEYIRTAKSVGVLEERGRLEKEKEKKKRRRRDHKNKGGKLCAARSKRRSKPPES